MAVVMCLKCCRRLNDSAPPRVTGVGRLRASCTKIDGRKQHRHTLTRGKIRVKVLTTRSRVPAGRHSGCTIPWTSNSRWSRRPSAKLECEHAKEAVSEAVKDVVQEHELAHAIGEEVKRTVRQQVNEVVRREVTQVVQRGVMKIVAETATGIVW